MQQAEGCPLQEAKWSAQDPLTHHGPVSLGGCPFEVPAWLLGSLEAQPWKNGGSGSVAHLGPPETSTPDLLLHSLSQLQVNCLPDDSLHP